MFFSYLFKSFPVSVQAAQRRDLPSALLAKGSANPARALQFSDSGLACEKVPLCPRCRPWDPALSDEIFQRRRYALSPSENGVYFMVDRSEQVKGAMPGQGEGPMANTQETTAKEHSASASKTLDPVFSTDNIQMPELISQILGSESEEHPEMQLEGKLDSNPKTAAIILAGGTGERFGREGGKQLVEIAGKPILTWSAEAFDAVGDIGLIVLVCPEDRQEEYIKRAVDPFPFVTPVVVAPAGTIRQESAYLGLEAVPDDFEFVVIHDGARPLVTPDLIEHAISTVKGNLDADGAVVAHPAIDTLKVVEDGMIVGTPDRRVFWNAQTPQVFRTGIYRRAQASALSDGFVGTDDSSLIERLGGRVLVIEGKRDNIKLTVPEDYALLASAVHQMFKDAK